MEAGRLSVGEFAFPGPLRDQLVAAIVGGAKTTTTGLLDDYERDGEPLPRPGDREVVIEMREYVGDPAFTVDDDTLAVAVEFHVVTGEDVDLAALLHQAQAGAR